MVQPRVVTVDHRGITVGGRKVRDLMLEDAFDVPTPLPPTRQTTPRAVIIEAEPAPSTCPTSAVEVAATDPDPKSTGPISRGLSPEARLAAREVVSVARKLAEMRVLMGVLEMRLVTAVMRYDQAAGLSPTPSNQASSDSQPGLVLRAAARIIREWCDGRPARARGFARGRPPVPIADRVVAATLVAGTLTSSRDAVPALVELGIRVHHNTVLRACRDAEVNEVLMEILRHEQVRCDVEVQLDVKARITRQAIELWNHAALHINAAS